MARTELGFRPQGLHVKAYAALILGVVIFALAVGGFIAGEHGLAILIVPIASAFGCELLPSSPD